VKTTIMAVFFIPRLLSTIILVSLYSGVCWLSRAGLPKDKTHLVYTVWWRSWILAIGQPMCRLQWLLT
jgi:hypothetical protein